MCLNGWGEIRTHDTRINMYTGLAIRRIKPTLPPIQERRGWDSNPRALADKRFSRPHRYDHFDTSPKI